MYVWMYMCRGLVPYHLSPPAHHTSGPESSRPPAWDPQPQAHSRKGAEQGRCFRNDSESCKGLHHASRDAWQHGAVLRKEAGIVSWSSGQVHVWGLGVRQKAPPPSPTEENSLCPMYGIWHCIVLKKTPLTMMCSFRGSYSVISRSLPAPESKAILAKGLRVQVLWNCNRQHPQSPELYLRLPSCEDAASSLSPILAEEPVS